VHTPPAGQFHLGHTVRVYCNLRTVVCRQRCCRSQAYLRGMKRRGANGIRTCSLAERRGNAAAQEPHDHGQAQVRLTSVVLTHGFAPDNAQRTVQPPPFPASFFPGKKIARKSCQTWFVGTASMQQIAQSYSTTGIHSLRRHSTHCTSS